MAYSNRFATGARDSASRTTTLNGANALNTTGSALLDFFSTCGALRNADEQRIIDSFEAAYNENPLMATRMLFYCRDIREGLGERRTPRVIFKWLAKKHPGALINNLTLFGEYGRWDDLYALVDTPLEKQMFKIVYHQLKEDEQDMKDHKPVSLLAKWLKSPDTSSKESSRLGVKTAMALRLGHDAASNVKEYKKLLKELRSYIDVVEKKMSSRRWCDIDYEIVPSRAMHIYAKAFGRHDNERFQEYIDDVSAGKSKVNAATLYPYDLVEKIDQWWNPYYRHETTDIRMADAQWANLPNYISGDANVIVMADTSGSMTGRPMASAIGLAIYFAERNKGPFKDLWMSFSGSPKYHVLKGSTLSSKLKNLDRDDWEMNTDLEAAMNLILMTAIKNDVPANQMPKALLIISDMEFDAGTRSRTLFHDEMKQKFEEAGYTMPTIVYWNVDSKKDTFHVSNKCGGAILVSGQSTTTFKTLLGSLEKSPMQFMSDVLNSERYSSITITTDPLPDSDRSIRSRRNNAPDRYTRYRNTRRPRYK